MSRILLSCFVVSLLAIPASSQEESSREAVDVDAQLFELIEEAREASESDHRYNLETLSCGEFDQLLASEDQADRAVLSMLIVWAHGYKSGMDGIDFEDRPITLEGMVELTRRVVDECLQHPEVLYHVAVERVD